MANAKQSVAGFITCSIRISGKLQKDIAAEIGYDRPNMISMLKKGQTALPLDKVGPLANALDVDPLYLFKLVMAEYYPKTYKSLEPVLNGLSLSEEEFAVIKHYRTFEVDDDRKLIGIIMEPK